MSIEKTRARLALLLLVPAPSIGVLTALWIAPGGFGQTIYALCKVWLIAFPLIWWLAVERRRISWSPLRGGGLSIGALSGIAIAATIVGAYWLLGPRLIDPEMMREAAGENGLDRKGVYLGFALYATLVNSLLEEYVWRWFVYRKCETLMAPRLAAPATAFFFSVHHALALYPQFGWGVTVVGSGGTFIGSLIWSWCYRRFGSLWPAYLSHICADIAVFGVGWTILFGGAG